MRSMFKTKIKIVEDSFFKGGCRNFLKNKYLKSFKLRKNCPPKHTSEFLIKYLFLFFLFLHFLD